MITAAHRLFQVGGFSPLSLAPALWLSDTGSNAAQWDDISGNGRHATQATGASQPAVVTNALNGKQVRRFDGINDFMSLATGLNIARNVAGVTIFGAWKYITLPNSGDFRVSFTISNGIANGASRAAVGTNLGTTKLFAAGRRLDANALQRVDSTANASTAPFIHSAVFDYANSDLYQYVNGSLDGSTTSFQSDGNTSDTDSVSVRVGSHTGTGNFTNIDMAEIIVFPRALSTTERQAVERYLSNKYAITI
jgi:hypothetical protein